MSACVSNTTKMVAERSKKPHVEQRDERDEKKEQINLYFEGKWHIYNARAKTS